MTLLFEGEITQDDIKVLTDGMDVDTASSNYMLMLAYLGHRKGWKYFPDEMIPRFKGLYRYYHVRNSLGIPGLVKQVQALSQMGIPVMLIKGMAMKAYYAPNVPRLMADMDILVPEEKFGLAKSVLKAMGATIAHEEIHSIHVLNGTASLDLHKWFFKTNGEKGTDLWERAIKINYQGVEVFVPSPEDMFIHILDTQSRNIILREGAMRRMKWLYDCRCVSLIKEEGLDWDFIAERAKQVSSMHRVRIMSLYFAHCFPNVIPENFFEKDIPEEAGYVDWLKSALKFEQTKIDYDRYAAEKNILMQIIYWPKLHKSYYIYLKPELKKLDPTINWFKYLKQVYSVDSYSALIKRMLRRFKEVRKGEL